VKTSQDGFKEDVENFGINAEENHGGSGLTKIRLENGVRKDALYMAAVYVVVVTVSARDCYRPLHMDCFGIGTTRLLAASVEVLSSNDDVRWPRLIAPYQICIIPQKVHVVAYLSWLRQNPCQLSSTCICKDVKSFPSHVGA